MPVVSRCAALLLLFACASICAQDLDPRGLGVGYAHMLGLAAEPEIAASSLDIDSPSANIEDVSLKAMRLPYYHEFDANEYGARWFGQLALGYLEFEETTVLHLPDGERFSVTPQWEALTGLLEAGYIWPLGQGWSIAPSLSLGSSRLENEVDTSNPLLGDILLAPLEGRVFNWDTNALIARGHLALKYDQWHGHWRFKAGAHLSYAHVDSYNESSDFDGFDDQSGTAIANLDISRRINSEQARRPVYLIGHLGSTYFIGADRDVLGFDSFHEIGASLGIGQYAAGVLAVFGSDVEGWNLTFNYNY